MDPENSGVRMEFVLAAPPVDTLETSQQMSGEGANYSGPFDSSTPEPSPRRVGTVGASIQPLPSFAPPRRVGTTAATHEPPPTFSPSANSTPGPSPKRHVPCALPPTRSVSPAPVDPAPVLPPGESRDGAGPSGSSAAASVKKKKEDKIGGAIVTVTCPDCGASSLNKSAHYNHYRVRIFFKQVIQFRC